LIGGIAESALAGTNINFKKLPHNASLNHTRFES